MVKAMLRHYRALGLTLLLLTVAAVRAPADTTGDLLARIPNTDLQAEGLIIHQLCQAPEVRMVAPVLKLILRHPKQFEEIQNAIASIRDPAVIDALMPFLTARDVRMREFAAFCLSNFDDPRLVAPLRAALSDSSAFVRERADAFFTQSKDPRAAGILAENKERLLAAKAQAEEDFRARLAQPGGAEKALTDGDPYVRVAALQVLGRRRDAASYPALFKLVDDPDRGVRDAFAAVLPNLRDPAVEPHLRALLKHPEARGRILGVEALAALRGTRAWPDLKSAQADADGPVRLAAVAALARLADERTIDDLIPALEDRDPGVRKQALAALAGATGQNYGYSASSWRKRPRLYGISNAPYSLWTVAKLLLLALVIFGMKGWADLAESIQLKKLSRDLLPPLEKRRTASWARHYARTPRVEMREKAGSDWLYLVMCHVRPHGGSVLYYLGLLALGYAIQIPNAALQQDALVASGLSHAYFEILTRLEDDRFFWVITLALGALVALA
jgi:HEAT repeat protein